MILVSDYDGTLNYQEISNSDIQAIKSFRQQGHLFGIATGRPLNMMYDELALYGFEIDFIIGTNGGIAQFKEVSIISRIRFETFRDLLSFLSKFENLMINVSNGYDWFSSINIQDWEKGKEVPEMPEGAINSILLRGTSSNQTKTIYRQLIQHGFQDLDFHFNSYGGGIIECPSKGVSKSSTIQRILIDEMKYPKEDIFTIGNSMNDLEMIRDFHGFTVLDCDPQILPHASAVFPDISACIEHLMSLR